MSLPKKLRRALRAGEALCRFGCNTIVQESINSCEMCCAEAIAERLARFPLLSQLVVAVAEEVKQNEPTDTEPERKRHSVKRKR